MRPTQPPRPRRGAKLPDAVRRERALMATMTRFQGRSFKLGRFDCVVLVRAHLVAMGRRGLPRLPKYRDPAGAMAALKGQGVKTLRQLLDKHLTRIPPAAMLPGDIALVKAEKGEAAWQAGTVVIAVGRKWLGWHPDGRPLAVIEPLVDRPFLAAWRA
jgi:hypothetical protein